MNNARKALIGIFLSIIIVSTLVHTVLAQKNETIDILQQENKTTTAQNATFSEVTQKSEVTKEDIIIESQRSLDRSLSILNIVATSMGALVGLITIIVIIAIAIVIFEYSKWKAIRKDIEKEANVIRGIRTNAEIDMNSFRENMKKLPSSLTEKPSKEVLEKFDDFNRKFETLEILGASLNSEDYLNRGHHLFYKGNYKLALAACEKAIELGPDNEKAWIGKGAVLDRLNRYDEALIAHEKALKLKPNFDLALINKTVTLIHIGRYDEAIEAAQKAIEGKTVYASAWYNIACAYSKKADKEKALSNLEKAISMDVSYKEKAKKDEDFEKFWNDKDFKKLVNET